MSVTTRHQSRCLSLQALYQWDRRASDIQSIAEVESELLAQPAFRGADIRYFRRIVNGVVTHVAAIEHQLTEVLDRPLSRLTPIERTVLRIGAYELLYESTVPYKVVINEALELNKQYGSNEGFKYVNAVLDALSQRIRS